MQAARPLPPKAEEPLYTEAEIIALAKRHRISPAIVREIIRSTGARERSAIEREIAKGKSRR